MSPTPLTRPISTLMRPTFLVPVESTVGTVASRLRENSAGIVPVVDGAILKGIVTEASLSLAIGNGAIFSDGVEVAFDREFLTIPLYETGAEALRRFDQIRVGTMIVVDDDHRAVGVLRASDLIDPPSEYARPPMVGGMATPFGVYLTSGTVGAGATGWALVSTGTILFTILTSATLLSYYLGVWLLKLGWHPPVVDGFTSFVQLVLFATSFRALPISGIHAAEHMVVHAIERGEPLIPSVVKRMPRVHPRCGTNLAVGASLFLGLATTPWIANSEIRLLVALVATVLFWRRLGGLVQYWITTRPPSDKHIAMGIQSAKELLERQATVRQVSVSFPKRLLNSGMFHVMFGSALVATLVALVDWLFNLNLPQ